MNQQEGSDLEQRCQKIRLLLLDCDGVLTDGSIMLDDQGVETKRFHVRDGSAMKMWQRAGRMVGIVSGRSGEAVKMRAKELSIDYLALGAADKRAVVQDLLEQVGAVLDEVCFVGDDLPDLPMVRTAGLGVAVADACPELQAAADYVTAKPGGHGAVRETIELLLKHQGLWAGLVESYDLHG